MPFVNVIITDEGASDKQKAQIISQITETLQTVLGKNPKTTHVVIQEAPVAAWGIGGLPCVEFRAKQEAQP
jgi:4-oxalocrotonate tautomerase|tara:strand:+ start:186 stop:398 length:213 start_codon:yes stop_codon:yes gene_type:complete